MIWQQQVQRYQSLAVADSRYVLTSHCKIDNVII
jgi:hypothetical protein